MPKAIRTSSTSLPACCSLVSSCFQRLLEVRRCSFATFLLLGNVGQSFITIAVSNSVSRTLPTDQVGVGMGMLAMTNFIGQGIAISIYDKVVDLGSAVIPKWNPLFSNLTGFIFSNMYFVLGVRSLLFSVCIMFRSEDRRSAAFQHRS